MTLALIVPTLNAERYLDDLLPALAALAPQPDEFLFIDSSSNDNTVERLRRAGYPVHVIPRSEFGHGKTRNLGASLVTADLLLFMTHDVLPHDPALIGEIKAAFNDPDTGLLYVRQLPHDDATLAARFSRQFNYPDTCFTRNAVDIPAMGVKAFRSSNACAAYRRKQFFDAGGFPEDVPVSEDTLLAAHLLLQGTQLRYLASTSVKHSHNYNYKQEFQRYFDIGAAHAETPWYDRLAANVGNEGRRYVQEEIRYLNQAGKPYLLLDMFFRNAVRWLGYKMGRQHRAFPSAFSQKLAMSSHYWKNRKDLL